MSAALRPHPFSLTWRQVRRHWLLLPIILAHLIALIVLQQGLVSDNAAIAPAEIEASFISSEQPVQQDTPHPAPAPARAPNVPVTKPAVTSPVVPVVNQAATAPAIASSAPPAPPVPATAPPAEAAPAPSAPTEPRMVTSGIEYIRKSQPVEPQISIKRREAGTVVLRVLVNEKGEPEKVDIQKTSGFERLDEAARQAVQAWLFKPHSIDGKAVPMYAVLPVNFSITD